MLAPSLQLSGIDEEIYPTSIKIVAVQFSLCFNFTRFMLANLKLEREKRA